ncbi:MAG: asparagine synthase (glutamine-hydrolyzing) [Phycisphaerales bacterium]|nr:asparagine synthase (glutamine-hydrolyzing) [Phycisphaerales bacterium]
MSARPGVVDAAMLRALAAPLAHRGPDDEGAYVNADGSAGLAFRRLSIIDLAGGHQPLSNEDETIWSVFNGEIYNYRALRAELESRGHRFRTAGDSETVVHLYEELGERCFEKLAGMFAIAIWDDRRRRLVLARDRLGKKPLAFALGAGRLFFASELKSVLAAPNVRPRIDARAAHEYLLFQYVPAPRCIYQGFGKLLPGHYAIIEADRIEPPRQICYWSPPESVSFSGAYSDARRELDQRLTAAVEKRLIADVPLGAFLSGGIDSSIVVALMRRLGVSPLRTFSIGFADARYDESAHARRVAAHFQTEHHERMVTPRAMDLLDRLTFLYDEPFGDSSAIPTYLVSQVARESITVALTGDGGDEGFGGYDRYFAAQYAAGLDFLPGSARRAISALERLLPRGRAKSRGNRVARFLSALGQPAWRRYLSWVNVFTPEQLSAGYRPEFRERVEFDAPLAWFRGLHQSCEGDSAYRCMRTDVLSYLPYDLLTKVDIASMGCSLECRAPFLDHELIEFALSLPTAWKMRAGVGKRILREWAADVLPPEILRRGKMGFGVPVGEWFRGELRDAIRSAVLSEESICARVFKRAWLERLLADHLNGARNHEHPLWLLLMLDRWQRRWGAVL